MQKRIIVSRLKLAVPVLVIIGSLCVVSAKAQSGGGYELTRSVMASSQLLSGGGYSLNATAGQTEAHRWNSDEYLLVGGFWGGGPRPMYRIWFPTIGSYIIVDPNRTGPSEQRSTADR